MLRTAISALRSSDGSLVMDKDGLCNLLRSFYLDLFIAVLCDSSARVWCCEIIAFFFPVSFSQLENKKFRKNITIINKCYLAAKVGLNSNKLCPWS